MIPEKLKKYTKRVDIIFNDAQCTPVLDKALKMTPDQIIQEIVDSGLRGRGGAGFPTGLKWKFASQQKTDKKYVVCNADEGEPGTFKDREILEKQAKKVWTGMAICAHTIGADEGYLYLRAEYNYLIPQLQKELDTFNADFKKKGLNFSIQIRSGSGAYICGEETSLIESMEGKRGEPRNKPPFPVVEGYLGKPTVVNNVETFVYTAMIISNGSKFFRDLGTKDSSGSKVFSVSGDTPYPGIFELELGMTLEEFVELFGDGDTKAVQVGGASGFCVPRRKFKETIIGFEGIPTGGSMMLFNSSRSMYNVLHNFLDFFCEESCGQCTPCRVGCQQLLKGIVAVKSKQKPSRYLEDLKSMSETMKTASKCGLGQSVPNSFNSIIDNFKEEVIY
jgi:[NiFe] hydrogenase diaphorase moiety large subunit